MENANQTLRPVDKAYVRSGKWSDKNWHIINADLGVDTNNAEPFFLKKSDGDFGREVFVTFDLSSLVGTEFKSAIFSPAFTTVANDAVITFNVHRVDAGWNGNEMTWNTKPALGECLAENIVAGGLSRLNLVDAVKATLEKGETKLSLAIVSTTPDSDKENKLNSSLMTLTVGDAESAKLFTRKLCEDEEENRAIWDWANTLYDEWYARYEKLLATGLAKVKKIESDPAHYSKEVFTARSGFAPATGWTPERVRKYSFPTRTYAAMDDLGKYTDYDREQKFDEFGGLMDDTRREEFRGFFYSKKINGRWWVIDPLGYPCYIRSMHAVKPCYLDSANQTNAAIVRFGSLEAWAEKTADLLKNEWYFNIADTDFAENTANRMPMQKSIPEPNKAPGQKSQGGFAGRFGYHVGSNCSNGGSTRFSENNTMNVFDPEFVPFSDEVATLLEARRDDPWILGYTSDNELPMNINMLFNYLTVDHTKPMNRYSYAAAWTWLIRMTGKDEPQQQDITKEHVELFRGFVWDRYYNVVTTAMRKHDPNHMILGTRFLTTVKNAEWVLRFASLYLDAITINWYGQWEPDADDLKKLCERADLPIMVTEFYTKAMDSGLANTRGAGWTVPTQQDRADFYQHFTLRLLECKNFVGWHWHQYIDDDPSPAVVFEADGTTWRDQSNIDANKGIVNSGHRPYDELVRGMAEINKNVFRLIEHFDAKYAD